MLEGLVASCTLSKFKVIAELDVKLAPVTVTCVSTGPDVGNRFSTAAGLGLVTVNMAAANAVPLVAFTALGPEGAPDGTLKVAEKAPAEVEVIVPGVVVTAVPANVIEIWEFGG